jgi:hypothetical protein
MMLPHVPDNINNKI